MMQMAMGQIKPNTADDGRQNFTAAYRRPVFVTVTRNLVNRHCREFLSHGLRVIVIVPQMDHYIRLYFLQTTAHKPQAGVRIR